MIRRFALLLVVLALVGAACGDDDSTATTAAGTTGADSGATIVIEDFSFDGPATVEAGTTITVENQDGVTHTWTASDGTFDSGNISGGGSFQATLDTPGEYDYTCTIHPDMQGSITVTG